VAFVNGVNLGRFWDIGPQKRLYIPGPLLRAGTNEIILFETEGRTSASIALWGEPDIG
jgi:beta-galactosidase